MMTRKHGYTTAVAPRDGHELDLWFDTNGATDPTDAQRSDALASVTRLEDATSGTPFYRLKLVDRHDMRDAKFHRLIPAVTNLDGDWITAVCMSDLDAGSDARDTSSEIDVVLRDHRLTLQAAYDAAFASIAGAFQTAVDTAINAGEAAVVGNDGGAAALAALETSFDSWDDAAAATTAAAAGAAALTSSASTTAVQAGLDAAIASAFADLRAAMDTAIDAAIAAVTATDGGAAALAALETSLDSYDESAAAATAAAAGQTAGGDGVNLTASLDAGLESLLLSLTAALDTAINAGEAAVSATDGGAAALAALETSFDSYAPATSATTAAAAAETAAATNDDLTNVVDSGRRVHVTAVIEIAATG